VYPLVRPIAYLVLAGFFHRISQTPTEYSLGVYIGHADSHEVDSSPHDLLPSFGAPHSLLQITGKLYNNYFAVSEIIISNLRERFSNYWCAL
jgi:hypothetical protein